MKNLLTYLLAILAFVACSDSGTESGGNGGGGQEIPKQPEITLSTTAADFSTDGGSNVIAFTSSEAWTAQVVNTRADDWCSIEPTSGPAGSAKITITTTENDTPDDRTASIIIKAGTASKTINVSQKQKDALTVTSSKFEVSAEGGEITIEVKANINFDFEIDDDAEDWITHRSTRALKTSQLVFEIDENEDTENRKANISISSGNLRETVTIYQEGNEPTIVLSDDEFTVSSSKETIAIDVKSNVDVAVEIPSNVNWIKENTSRAFSTNTYYFDIAQNDGYDNRTAEIQFTNKENGIYEKVKITQMQRDTLYINNSIPSIIDSFGGEFDLKVDANVEFKVSISDNATSWITMETTRALDSSILHIKVSENSSNNQREGIITIEGNDITKTTSIKQSSSNQQILYTSINKQIVSLYSTQGFKSNVVSNRYDSDKNRGVMIFNSPITEIGNNAFQYREYLSSIVIPNSVKSIGGYAFQNCSNLTSITIPEGVTEIGWRTFDACSSLINIVIPNSVKSIGDYAFRGCSSLTSISIPEGISEIGAYSFGACTNLVKIALPNSLTRIETHAFSGCSNLSSITIPKGVAEIEEAAFYGCSNLSSFTIPKGVAEIRRFTFYHCSRLSSITIPDSVTSIGDYAFEGCGSLSSITIPDSVKDIGKEAFGFCLNLSNVTIPESVTYINERAYFNCTSLMNITIPNSVTEIGPSAFAQCKSLTSIIIPNSVKSIGGYAFNLCTSLKEVYCKSTTPPKLIGSAPFSANAPDRKFYVPKGSVETYKTADGWKGNSSAIVGYDFDGESGSDDPSESEDDSELENPEDGGTTDW